MSEKKKESSGLEGILNGLGNLIEAVSRISEKGEDISKSGEIRFSGLDALKGLKDLQGVYGVRVRTLADGKPSIKPFGNIKRSPKGPVVEKVREPMLDIFEEADHILVVAEMPGIDSEDIRLDLKGDILLIAAERGDRSYRKEVLLSSPGKTDEMTWSYKNGILEIRIAI